MRQVVYDMPADQYHAIEAMSASGVSPLLRSAGHHFEHMHGTRKQTAAQALGELAHMGVLEPQRFKDKLWVWDKPEGREKTDDKKAREEEFTAARLAGNVVVEKEVFNQAIRIIYAIQSHPAASRLLANAVTEVSMLWTDPRHDISCKARLDGLHATGTYAGVVFDVKTTDDASPLAFSKSAANYLYHAQAAFYCIAHEVCLDSTPNAFVWIAAEKEPPYGVACYVMESDAHNMGRALVEDAMTIYATAAKTGKWPLYPQEIRPLRFPKWALVRNI